MNEEEQEKTKKRQRKDSALGWYTSQRAIQIFENVKNATLFTQNEVYLFAREFVEWFEAQKGPKAFAKKYGTSDDV